MTYRILRDPGDGGAYAPGALVFGYGDEFPSFRKPSGAVDTPPANFLFDRRDLGRLYRWSAASSTWLQSADLASVESVTNVTAFGATGSGTSDDTTSIQAAIDYVDNLGGGTVFLPKGIYRLSSTLLLSRSSNFKTINLVGSGMLGTLLRWYGPTNQPAIRINGLKQYLLEGFVVENKVSKGTTVGALVQRDSGTGTQSGGCVWRNVRITDFAKGAQIGNIGITQAGSEFHFDHLVLERNDIGCQIQDFNSLNFAFSMLELSTNGIGIQVLSGGSSLSVNGGATGYNTTAAFDFQAGANYAINSVRSEHDDRFLTGSSTGARRNVTLRSCDITATGNADGYGVRIPSGPISLINNHFDTKVACSGAAGASVSAMDNTIVNSEMVNFSVLGGSGGHYSLLNNRQVDASGVHVAHFADEVGYIAAGVRVPSWKVPASGVMQIGTFTVATLPAAASYPGAIVYVSDAAAGSKLQYSDGSSWVAAG